MLREVRARWRGDRVRGLVRLGVIAGLLGGTLGALGTPPAGAASGGGSGAPTGAPAAARPAGLLGGLLGATGDLLGASSSTGGDPSPGQARSVELPATGAAGSGQGGSAPGVLGALGSTVDGVLGGPVGGVLGSAGKVLGGTLQAADQALGVLGPVVRGATGRIGGSAAGAAAPVSSPPRSSPPLSADPYTPGTSGYDISWPQCAGPYPPAAPVAVVGVNDGVAFSENPCYASEARWAGQALTTYVNLNAPEGSDPGQWDQGPASPCPSGDLGCEAYNYGYQSAQQSLAEAAASGHPSRIWWLDVETANYWTSSTAVNDQVIAGALAAIRAAGDWVGIYSTNYQWNLIAGSYRPGVPAWYPTGSGPAPDYQPWCTPGSFAGGPVDLVQHAAGSFDGDAAC